MSDKSCKSSNQIRVYGFCTECIGNGFKEACLLSRWAKPELFEGVKLLEGMETKSKKKEKEDELKVAEEKIKKLEEENKSLKEKVVVVVVNKK